VGEVVNRLDPVPAHRTVTARLMAPSGWRSDVSGWAETVTAWTTQVDTDGTWTLTLPASSSFEIDNTWYRITEPGARHAIVVPGGDGPFELHDIAVSDPDPPACCPPPPAGSVGARFLDDLDDVSGAGAAVTGQVLVKQTGGQWSPATIEGGGILAGQLRLTAVAAVTVSGHRLVTPDSDGTIAYASPTNLAHMHAPLWLTLTAATAGDPVEVLTFGAVSEPSWSWTTGPLYLGTNGLLTRTPPVKPGALFSAQVGSATAEQAMFLDRSPSILLT
jgi:hypothetical protein